MQGNIIIVCLLFVCSKSDFDVSPSRRGWHAQLSRTMKADYGGGGCVGDWGVLCIYIYTSFPLPQPQRQLLYELQLLTF